MKSCWIAPGINSISNAFEALETPSVYGPIIPHISHKQYGHIRNIKQFFFIRFFFLIKSLPIEVAILRQCLMNILIFLSISISFIFLFSELIKRSSPAFSSLPFQRLHLYSPIVSIFIFLIILRWETLPKGNNFLYLVIWIFFRFFFRAFLHHLTVFKSLHQIHFFF